MTAYLKLLCTAAFWGGTFVTGRSLARTVDPLSGAFFRFLVASLFLVLLTVRKEGRITAPPRNQWVAIILLGLTGAFAYNFFFFKGLKLIEAGRAAAIIAGNPIFIALFAAVLFKERLTAGRVAGILISVVGAIIVISRGDLVGMFQRGLGLGELYILGCVASWVAFSLIGKASLSELSPLRLITYSAIVGAISLSVPAFLESHFLCVQYSLLDWANIVYLGCFGTAIGFVWYYEGIRAIGATRAGLFISFVPISAVLLAWLFLNESITMSLCVGATLVSLGAYLTNRVTEVRMSDSVREETRR